MINNRPRFAYGFFSRPIPTAGKRLSDRPTFQVLDGLTTVAIVGEKAAPAPEGDYKTPKVSRRRATKMKK